ncbi:hypothetical protein [Paenibacillus nasutitermitis]|uniref:Uncharacterized protein n=1 Tax=Paenibacillus nasutitermitis TaxID=1652958 RepID=A0A916YXQ5_9BACL|nr:hypothetical protein [Paenibacillus nasutitermitis]GGD66884.1 hypothetical protein GCM10010911_25800 [Paenibacillus nasutitermitis]
MKKLSFCAAVLVASLAFSITNANAVGNGRYEPVPQSTDMQTAFVNHIDYKDGKLLLTADYIQWLEGAAADEAFLKDEPDSGLDGAPDGYYVINSDPQLRTLELDPDAQIVMQIYDHSGLLDDLQPAWNETIPVSKFMAIYGDKHIVDLSSFPYHLTIQGGKVVRIVQQYIP